MSTLAPQTVRHGSGVPLLFVHGNGVDHRMMLALDDAFDAANAWERIYLDLPGFGAAPALEAPGGLPELADWLDGAAEMLVGGSTPFAVVGSSLGGLLARDLAARRPRQCLGIALLAPVVDPVRERRTLPEPVVLATDESLVASLEPEEAKAYTEFAVVQSPENWSRFREAVLPGAAAADATAMARLAERYELPVPPDDRLSGYDGPVLVLAGRQDAVVGFEDQWRLAQRLPRADYAVLDRAGHNVQVDRPDAVRALLRGWAAAVARSRPDARPRPA